eukprot:scaffold8922_cov215-Ochromonas_danica.AAC.1
MAGKTLSSEDIALVMGPSVLKVIPIHHIKQLKQWLSANQHNGHNFRPANPLLVDAGLQRLFSFWPTLHIHVESSQTTPATTTTTATTTAINNKSSNNKTETSSSSMSIPPTTNKDHEEPLGFSQIKLRWINKMEAGRVFRDPDSFQPNLNSI